MVAKPDAKVVFLKQTRAGITELNRNAFRLSAMGCVVNSGDQLIAYKVDSTVPDGPVVVTDYTRFVFSS